MKVFVEDFKEQLVITNGNGNVDVATLHSTAAKILQEFQSRNVSVNIELERMRIIKALVDIIKALVDIIKHEIKQLDNNTTFYPTVEEIETSNNFLLFDFM